MSFRDRLELESEKNLISLALSKEQLCGPLDDFNTRLIHIAARRGFPTLVSMALDQDMEDGGGVNQGGTLVNAATAGGETPLLLACEYGQRDIAALLLARGANPTVRNKMGQTPIEIARGEYPDIVEIIEQHVPASKSQATASGPPSTATTAVGVAKRKPQAMKMTANGKNSGSKSKKLVVKLKK